MNGAPEPEAHAGSETARWLVRVRWAALACAAAALLAELTFGLAGIGRGPATAIAAALVATAAVNLVLHLRTRSGVARTLDVFVSFVLDLLAITIVLHMTGGIENPFQVYYAFPVILAG